MEITEFQDGNVRCPCWCFPDEGWDELCRKLDDFLCEAILAVSAAYQVKPAAWLEVNHWPDSGRLIVYPSDNGPFGGRNETICFQLFSDFLQHEFDRICELPEYAKQPEWDAL